MTTASMKIVNDQSTQQLARRRHPQWRLGRILPVDPRDPEQVQEFVNHSWYKYGDETKGLHPWDGVTEPNYVLGANTKGTKHQHRADRRGAKYSWIKSPRWRGHAMEVGPLSRYILGYAHALKGNQYCQRVKEQVESSARIINSDFPKALGMAETSYTARQLLPTTIGRTLARALEAQYCAEMMLDDYKELVANIKAGDTTTANVEKWDPATWPKEAKGVGTVAAPRGMLGHWIKIKDGASRTTSAWCRPPGTAARATPRGRSAPSRPA
jgi:hydrogenase large subunit